MANRISVIEDKQRASARGALNHRASKDGSEDYVGTLYVGMSRVKRDARGPAPSLFTHYSP